MRDDDAVLLVVLVVLSLTLLVALLLLAGVGVVVVLLRVLYGMLRVVRLMLPPERAADTGRDAMANYRCCGWLLLKDVVCCGVF